MQHRSIGSGKETVFEDQAVGFPIAVRITERLKNKPVYGREGHCLRSFLNSDTVIDTEQVLNHDRFRGSGKIGLTFTDNERIIRGNIGGIRKDEFNELSQPQGYNCADNLPFHLHSCSFSTKKRESGCDYQTTEDW